MANLDTEWREARTAFAWCDYSALLGSVDKKSLSDALFEIRIGAADIVVKDRRWARLFRGQRAIIVPAHNPFGEIIDLIAFRMDTPRSFWPLTGMAMALGEDQIDRAAALGEPLIVHECPLEWLRAGRRGCVVVDWAHYWPFYLGAVPALQFEDREFAARAVDLMQRPVPIPPVFVRPS